MSNLKSVRLSLGNRTAWPNGARFSVVRARSVGSSGRLVTGRVLLSAFASLAVFASTAPSAGAVLVYVRPSSHEVVVARDDGSQPRVVAHGLYARVSPDGRQLVYEPARGRAELRVMSVRGGRSWLVARNPAASPGVPSTDVSWSPNGRYIAVGQDPDGLVLYDVVRRRRRHLGPVVSGGESFSPESSRLAFQSNDVRENDLLVTNVATGKVRRLAQYAESPVWGRGGLAYIQAKKPAGLILKTRRSRLLVPFDSSVMYPVEWSRDGRRLLAAKVSPQFPLHAFLIAPSTRRITTLSPVFKEVDALSRDGTVVLGVINGDVVTVTASGTVTLLAHGADSASWTR